MKPDKIVQIISATPVEMYALTESGEIFHRTRDPKDMNMGPVGPGPKFLWSRIKLPGED